MPNKKVIIILLIATKDNSQITLMFEGMPMGFDSAPILENGRTYVLAKNLFNNLGLEYTYNEESNKYIVNGLDFDAKENYVPLRLVLETLGYKVNWYQSSMSVSIGR